jgi:ribosomal protein S18 acetylase RimI-like enzyme
MNITVLVADYTNPQHATDLALMLDVYASDPMGGGGGISDHVKQNLASELAKLPHAFSVLCYVDDKPAGLVNCFEVFSTFKCKPIVNIHDLAVAPEFRGLGISQKMLDKVSETAQDRGCSKLTLEVLEGNKVAQNAYLKYGFKGYELDPTMGRALFWEMPLTSG